MPTAYILGAGFSRAISPHMPLTDELGNSILQQVPEMKGRAPEEFRGGRFEAWLSRIAEPQPDLDDYENHLNAALFAKVTTAIHELMHQHQFEVLQDAPPEWLLRLVAILHARGETVITFNYDTLLEHALTRLRLGNWRHGQPGEIANVRGAVLNIPPSYRVGGFPAEKSVETFRLLKLHGSLDSYWVPGDSTGATISRWKLAGRWGDPVRVSGDSHRVDLPGREPFIVPPAAAKSAFYSNPISRELWRTAVRALRDADRIALVGYSIPPTDLVTSGMLADAASGRDVWFDVVNPNGTEVAERLTNLGVPPERIETIDGDDPVERYVAELERATGLTVPEHVRAANEADRIVVGASSHPLLRVFGTYRDASATYVDTEPSAVETDAHALTVADLIPHLIPDAPIRVRYQGGLESTIVSIGFIRTADTSTVLIPALMPPD